MKKIWVDTINRYPWAKFHCSQPQGQLIKWKVNILLSGNFTISKQCSDSRTVLPRPLWRCLPLSSIELTVMLPGGILVLWQAPETGLRGITASKCQDRKKPHYIKMTVEIIKKWVHILHIEQDKQLRSLNDTIFILFFLITINGWSEVYPLISHFWYQIYSHI